MGLVVGMGLGGERHPPQPPHPAHGERGSREERRRGVAAVLPPSLHRPRGAGVERGPRPRLVSSGDEVPERSSGQRHARRTCPGAPRISCGCCCWFRAGSTCLPGAAAGRRGSAARRIADRKATAETTVGRMCVAVACRRTRLTKTQRPLARCSAGGSRSCRRTSGRRTRAASSDGHRCDPGGVAGAPSPQSRGSSRLPPAPCTPCSCRDGGRSCTRRHSSSASVACVRELAATARQGEHDDLLPGLLGREFAGQRHLARIIDRGRRLREEREARRRCRLTHRQGSLEGRHGGSESRTFPES